MRSHAQICLELKHNSWGYFLLTVQKLVFSSQLRTHSKTVIQGSFSLVSSGIFFEFSSESPCVARLQLAEWRKRKLWGEVRTITVRTVQKWHITSPLSMIRTTFSQELYVRLIMSRAVCLGGRCNQ